ncbi:MAG: RraA family protein [Methanosphaera sp.]|nr:RraA family protein [Methanosphaera sp.]
MSRGKITPNNILHFNNKGNVDEDIDVPLKLSADNLLDFASSDNVSDALKSLYGFSGLVSGVKPVCDDFAVCGFIRTVETSSFDWGTGIKAIYECNPGEILFIKCSDEDYAIWGELASQSALCHGVAATIIVGASRDTVGIRKLEYPVFSSRICSCAGFASNGGVMDSDLFVGNLVVKSGDFVVADVDGVVVIPQDKLDDVLLEVSKILDFENELFDKVVNDNKRLDNLLDL